MLPSVFKRTSRRAPYSRLPLTHKEHYLKSRIFHSKAGRGSIHFVCSFLLKNRRVHWKTLFTFNEASKDDATVVVRVDSTVGLTERVQGYFIFQQYGTNNLFRLVVDGHLPPSNTDNCVGDQEAKGGQQEAKGKRLLGAINLPDVFWVALHKKVKSNNDTAIRGRSSRLSFKGDNMTGVQSIQVSFIHHSPRGKEISASFQQVIDKATMASNHSFAGDGNLR